MNLQKYRFLGTVATLAWSGTLIGAGVAAAQQDNSSAGAEVLTRGPVHEAFAGTVSYDPEPGALIDRQPPTAIEEVPHRRACCRTAAARRASERGSCHRCATQGLPRTP